MTDGIDGRPPQLAVIASTVAGLGATIVLATADPLAALPGVLAVVSLVVAGRRRSRWALGAAAMAFVASFMLAGLGGASPDVVIGSAVLAVVAWDVLEHGITLGEHVGRDARTQRNIVVHGGTTLLVGTLVAGVAIASIAVVPAGWPVMALVFAIVAGVLALLMIDRPG